MLHRWCTDTVEVRRAPMVESRGTQVRDWSQASSHELHGCSVQPASTSSDMDGREGQVTDRWHLFAQPGADIKAGDRVEFAGQSFEVDGAPFEWKSPTGRVSNIQAHLVEWRG